MSDPAIPGPVALEDAWCAHTYASLPVTLVAGLGSWVEDDRGVEYLDLIGAYSAP